MKKANRKARIYFKDIDGISHYINLKEIGQIEINLDAYQENYRVSFWENLGILIDECYISYETLKNIEEKLAKLRRI